MFFYLRKLPALLSLSLFVLSCDVVDEVVPAAVTNPPAASEIGYVIQQGGHETTNPLKGVSKNQLRFEVTFDSTAIYKTVDPNNQADINKLYGMSDCNSFHHQNSARFGWRWYKNQLELHAYSYRNGVNTSTFITAIDLKKKYTCEVSLTGNKYTYKVNGKTVEHERGCNGDGKGYQLYPYFGGDETAPHQIKITIKEL